MADRLQEIFEIAVDLEGGERRAYIRRICGTDATLRAEVDALLRAHERAAGFLASQTADGGLLPDALATLDSPSSSDAVAAMTAPPLEGPGTKIGPYKLLQLIGEGGFGTVFMAEQTAPVQRKVALKIIKLGMDTRQVVARFEQERQALAMMDHPNIARVAVEHPFAWIKNMGHRRVRYRGQRRNEFDFGLMLVAYNWKRSLSLTGAK